VDTPVRAGFPSPADDYLEAKLDLTEHLVKHPSATYYIKAMGDSMVDYGIFSGDLLIVDRSLTPQVDDVVIAAIDGELTCKCLGLIQGQYTSTVFEHQIDHLYFFIAVFNTAK